MSDHYIDTQRKAAKQHRCWLCRRTIRKGEQYTHSVALVDGSAYTNKSCGHCYNFVSVAYQRTGDGDGYDEDLLREFEPRSIPEARVRAEFQRRWQRSDGSLYPVPTIEWYEDKYGFKYPVGLTP